MQKTLANTLNLNGILHPNRARVAEQSKDRIAVAQEIINQKSYLRLDTRKGQKRGVHATTYVDISHMCRNAIVAQTCSQTLNQKFR